MTAGLRVVMAQFNATVGDIPGNTDGILSMAHEAVQSYGADIVVFPELALTGYPPEDLLLRPSLGPRVERAVERIAENMPEVILIFGAPLVTEEGLVNAAMVLDSGRVFGHAEKQYLPNQDVFDEKRWFVPGTATSVFELRGLPVAVTICEDIWHDRPAATAADNGARLLINLNASPYHLERQPERRERLATLARAHNLGIIYVNLVGGQDELVFDGGSLAFDGQGRECAWAPRFDEALHLVQLGADGCLSETELAAEPDEDTLAYRALCVGLRDYIDKNGFPSVVLGLSGGIDSALTLAVAVDALGADRVSAVMMPFRYTSGMSLEDAERMADGLGVDYRVLSIESIYDAFMETLAEPFGDRAVDTTEENLQARIRGTLLMSLSNKFGSLVLTTGNKSELAVGYSTLYGDMAGGFSVLKDVSKTLVYRLSRWRNREEEAIPRRIIERPPSAELAPGQKDEDSLPPYEVLDRILERYVEQDVSAEGIIAEGYDRVDVMRAVRLVDINEYKRRQAPIGTRITRRGFGRDRRYPITNRWRAGD
ncbi:NAD+ synthase [Vreelandella utahensis]|uniref:NAD+ synthase n=1 Tax=Vreelandella halophila TaxID=86177 RepID=UPI001C4E1D61|nr:NAD+ synthase [Halomonas utahensis]